MTGIRETGLERASCAGRKGFEINFAVKFRRGEEERYDLIRPPEDVQFAFEVTNAPRVDISLLSQLCAV